MKTIKTIITTTLTIVALFFNQSCVINDVNAIRGDGNVIEKKYDIKSFNEIDLKGTFNVIMIKGEEENLIIETDENLHQHIFVENKNDKLILYSGRDVLLRPTKLKVEVTYNTLEKISSSGACNISSDATIKADSFTIDISGAASGDLDLDSEELVTIISGAGDFTLTGNAQSHKAVLSGASSLNASELITQSTDIKLSGAGAATVYASEKLKANLSGVGSIKYHGNPIMKDTSISGIGQIKSAN